MMIIPKKTAPVPAAPIESPMNPTSCMLKLGKDLEYIWFMDEGSLQLHASASYTFEVDIGGSHYECMGTKVFHWNPLLKIAQLMPTLVVKS